ncbi:MFS transporter [Streptomyces sp. A7024]|uniref:MFS transporter n=1 Tax=Streptomyces coryli TaxID=1128680 RepID=A0A6G4U196_9ACTN|nr:MFS transporter [Streptomyces coryli]NGN66005.1 MFS transporter [Streptomyces coryli]
MSSPVGAPSYRAVLRTPHAARTFLTSLTGRLSYGTVFLSLMLAITAGTGSYAVAGGVIAVFGLTVSLLAPVRAGLIDRYGPRRALPPMSVAYAAALTALAAAVEMPGGAPVSLLVALGAGAGMCAPPLGPVMRSVWSDLVPEPALRQRAFSLDTISEELLYVTGPLLAGLVASLAHPALGVIGSAGLVLAGTLAFVASPPVRAVAPAPAPTTASVHKGRRRSAGAIPLQPVAAAAGLGLALGSLALLLVMFADSRHQLTAVAWLEAALAVGSTVGGLLYGARSWRRPAHVRLPLLTSALALALAATGSSPGLLMLAAWTMLAGLFVAPALTTAYLLAEESTTPDSRTRAGTWVNTAFNLGSSLGYAGTGLLDGHLPLAACFAVAAVPLLASTAFAQGKRKGCSDTGLHSTLC